MAIGCDYPSRLESVHHRHVDVHQDHVRLRRARECDRRATVSGLANHEQVVGPVEQGLEARPHDRLIVGEKDPDRHGRAPSRGRTACTRKPPPGAGPCSMRPPMAAARSAMPVSP